MIKPSRRSHIKWFLYFSLVFGSCNLYSELDDYLRRDPGPTSTNYGGTGLLEIPTARFMEEGTFKIGLNSSFPYEMTAVTTTPFSWMEATFRYTEVKNQKYGPVYYSGNQTLKDKSFDFKVKLVEESVYLPSIAIGMRDIGGTGLFSSEYITATKNFGLLDLTLGV